MQDQHNEGMFHSLPYEIAHAVVRTLCLHTHAFVAAKNDYAKLKGGDPNEKKKKTITAGETMTKLADCVRFCVVNRRTGFVATQDWLSKHITVGEDGKPRPKKDDSKCKPWILSLKIVIKQERKSHTVALELKTCDAKPFRTVKCFDLRDGQAQNHLQAITNGYDYLFEEHAPPEDRFLEDLLYCNMK